MLPSLFWADAISVAMDLRICNQAVMSVKELLIPEKLPRHVAVIMDGNGRWAKQRGSARVFGHKNESRQ